MYKIGEFAKMGHVSIHLLRYYDKIGLLVPSWIDEQTGYRFYQANQLPRLNRILVLKDLGFSLEQIAIMLDENIAPDEMHGMLRLKRAQVEKTIAEEQSRLARIESRLKQIDEEGIVYDINVKDIPSQPVYIVSEVQSDKTPYVRSLFNESYKALQSVNACPGIPFVVTSFCVNGYYELGYFASKPLKSPLELSKGYVLQDDYLPAAENMASYVFSGKSSELNVAYGRMVNWLEANGLQFTYPSRELYMHSSREGDEVSYIVEIQMPIAERD